MTKDEATPKRLVIQPRMIVGMAASKTSMSLLNRLRILEREDTSISVYNTSNLGTFYCIIFDNSAHQNVSGFDVTLSFTKDVSMNSLNFGCGVIENRKSFFLKCIFLGKQIISAAFSFFKETYVNEH